MAANKTVEKAKERERLEKYWLGRMRYWKVEDGARRMVSPNMYTEWFTPEGIEREVCVKLDSKNEPQWMAKPDAPPPPTAFNPDEAGKSQATLNPAAEIPPFDYIPPAYNRDTHSGGPANFDGNAGGAENPRNPLLEGEYPDQYLREKEAHIADLEARLADLETRLSEASTAKSGANSLKQLIDAKQS